MSDNAGKTFIPATVIVSFFALVISAGQAWMSSEQMKDGRAQALLLKRIDACANAESGADEFQRYAPLAALLPAANAARYQGQQPMVSLTADDIADIDRRAEASWIKLSESTAMLGILGPEPLAISSGKVAKLARASLEQYEAPANVTSTFDHITLANAIAAMHKECVLAVGIFRGNAPNFKPSAPTTYDGPDDVENKSAAIAKALSSSTVVTEGPAMEELKPAPKPPQ